MNSGSLLEMGFVPWGKFEPATVRVAPLVTGVYAFRDPKESVSGDTDIVYIGRAQGTGDSHTIRKALNQYLHPGRSQRVKLRVGKKAATGGWEVSWMACDDPVHKECELIRRFFKEHGRLPRENLKHPCP